MDIRFLDRVLICQDCGCEFVWSAGEQEFYAVMGFGNEPRRCPECRRLRRYGARRPPELHEAVCHKCKQKAYVPFVPREDRPVYCRKCYDEMSAVNPAA